MMTKRPFTAIANQIQLKEKPILDLAFSFILAKTLAYSPNVNVDTKQTTVDMVDKLYKANEYLTMPIIDKYNYETVCNIDEIQSLVLSFFRYFISLRTGSKLTVTLSDIPGDFSNMTYFVGSDIVKTIIEEKTLFYKLVRLLEPCVGEIFQAYTEA